MSALAELRNHFPLGHELAALVESELAEARLARDATRSAELAAVSVVAAEAFVLRREAAVASGLRFVEEAETKLVHPRPRLPRDRRAARRRPPPYWPHIRILSAPRFAQ